MGNLGHVESTFPPEGGYHALPVGITEIDFVTRRIIYPDGSIDALLSGLQNTNHLWMHTLFLYSDQAITFKFDDHDYRNIRADAWYAVRRTSFQKIYIKTSVANTSIDLTASTDPDGEISMSTGMKGSTDSALLIETDEDSDFIAALITDASEDESITGLQSNKIRIDGLTIASVQSLHYSLLFYSTDAFDYDHYLGTIDIDLPTYADLVGTRYLLDLTQLDFDCVDEDGTQELHMRLINKSAANKNAGATGYIQFRVKYSPRR